jgi:tRNA uridine 5-carboxymethylaminomethyl modification enzyme
MFTSRAEFRLHLRIDNADRRLTPIGHRVGIIGEDYYREFEAKCQRVQALSEFLAQCRPDPSTPAGEALYSRLAIANGQRPTLAQMLKRPGFTMEDCEPLLREWSLAPSPEERKIVETDIKYGGYLAQQQLEMERLKKAESRIIPAWFEYGDVPGLSREMVEKFTRVRPRTLGQASRIPGVTPAAVAIVNVYVEMRQRASQFSGNISLLQS